MSEISLNQLELLQKIAAENGMKNVEILNKSTLSKGENYLGNVSCLEIREKSGKKIDVFLKRAQTDEKIRRTNPVTSVYDRETLIYSMVFANYLELQEERGIPKKYDVFPKYYGSSSEENQESIVLEDLKAAGFDVCGRNKPMNHEQITMVFQAYAKIHALSYAFKKLRPEMFKKVVRGLHDLYFKQILSSRDDFEGFVLRNIDSALKVVAGDDATIQKLKNLKQSMEEMMTTLMTNNDYGKKGAIVHADCWSNNLMFKYEGQNLTDVKLIDWQFGYYAKSPVLDLTFAFYANASEKILKNWKKYLEIYHETARAVCDDFGFSLDEFLTEDDLISDWKLYAKLGIQLAFVCAKIMYAKEEDTPDILKFAEDGLSIWVGVSSIDLTSCEDYRKRINDIVTCAIEDGLI